MLHRKAFLKFRFYCVSIQQNKFILEVTVSFSLYFYWQPLLAFAKSRILVFTSEYNSRFIIFFLQIFVSLYCMTLLNNNCIFLVGNKIYVYYKLHYTRQLLYIVL